MCDNAEYFHGHIDETLEELGLSQSQEQDTQGRPAVKSRDIIDIVEGYKGRGYGLSTDEELGKCNNLYFNLWNHIIQADYFPHFSSVGGNFLSDWHHS